MGLLTSFTPTNSVWSSQDLGRLWRPEWWLHRVAHSVRPNKHISSRVFMSVFCHIEEYWINQQTSRRADFESASGKSRFGRLELVFPGAHADCLWIFWNLRFNIPYCIQVYNKIRECMSGQESLRRSVVCKVTHFEASVQCYIQLFWHIKYQKNHAYVGYSN